jgi:hypothetical protein
MLLAIAVALALQSDAERIAEAVRALDGDDLEARERAVDTLIDLGAADAVRDLAKGEGEVALRAQKIIAAVEFLRGAPGFKQARKDNPAAVPAALIAALADAPRLQWPAHVGTAHAQKPGVLDAKTRAALASDILSDTAVTRDFFRELASALADRQTAAEEAPRATWWFCLEAAANDKLENREAAAALLQYAVAELPVELADEIAGAVRTLLLDYDRRVPQRAVETLAAAMRRVRDDKKRLAGQIDAIVALFADDDQRLPRMAVRAFMLGRGDPVVHGAVAERMMAALRDERRLVREWAMHVLSRPKIWRMTSPDETVKPLLAAIEDAAVTVRLPAIQTLAARTPNVIDEQVFESAVRGLLARFRDEDDHCRMQAASAIAAIAREDRTPEPILRDCLESVDAALRDEKHDGARLNLKEAAAELKRRLEK